MEGANGVRAPADAGDDRVRQRAALGQYLCARLTANDGLQLAHQIRIRMRADGRAHQVIGLQRIRHPGAQRLVDRRPQRAVTAGHGNELRTEQPHAPDIGCLPFHVDLAHVHRAREPQPGARRRARHAVLARAGLRDDAFGAEPLCQ